MIGHMISIIALAFLTTFLARYFNLAYLLGFHLVIYNQHPGPCRIVPGIDRGSEDITVTSHGLAFISSGLYPYRYIFDPTVALHPTPGKIFLFDFNHPNERIQELHLIGNFDRDNFYPHGISLHEDTDEIRLFVVNHFENNTDAVIIFRFNEKEKSLSHLKTITGKTMYSVNDVLAVGPESCYYTNDRYSITPFGRKYEIILNLELGNIGFYEPRGKDRIVASGYQAPNGINTSPDGRYLYVASSRHQYITVFERKSDNYLNEVQRINVHTGVDNIEVDRESGDLWLGCHPIPALLPEYMANLTKRVGSHVLKVHFDSSDAPYSDVDIQQVLMDDGTLVSGSSVASFYNNKMLIGTVVDKMAYCEIKNT
ncbi:serum paraoxonase/arylesterase 1-like [Saccoglossus kowalevskii]